MELCHPKYRCDTKICSFHFRENIASHFEHELAADVEAKAAAAFAAAVGTAPEAVKYVDEFLFGECGAAVCDCNEPTVFFAGKTNADFSAVTVLYGIFHDILKDFNTSVSISYKDTI